MHNIVQTPPNKCYLFCLTQTASARKLMAINYTGDDFKQNATARDRVNAQKKTESTAKCRYPNTLKLSMPLQYLFSPFFLREKHRSLINLPGVLIHWMHNRFSNFSRETQNPFLGSRIYFQRNRTWQLIDLLCRFNFIKGSQRLQPTMGHGITSTFFGKKPRDHGNSSKMAF